MVLFSQRVDAYLCILGVASAVVFLYLFGVHGFLRSVPLGLDFVVFHKAAALFLQGGNPWLELMRAGEPFSYPPHTASLLALYGFLPNPVALAIHTFINIFSIAVLAYLANLWFLKIDNFRSMSLAQGFSLAVLIGNPFMAHSVYEGQLVLPAVAMLMLSWHFLKQDKAILAGVFLGLATLKPQISIIYIVWLLLTLNFRVLIVGAATTGVMLIPALIAFGPIGTFSSWITSLSGYSSVSVNIPGSAHVVGLESFFAAIGVANTGWLFKPLGVVATILLFKYRENFDNILVVHLFLVFALTFIYGHDTDYSSIIIMWSLMPLLALQSGKVHNYIIALLLLLGFFFPQRILREYNIPPLHHTRTFLIPLCCYFVYVLQKNKQKNI